MVRGRQRLCAVRLNPPPSPPTTTTTTTAAAAAAAAAATNLRGGRVWPGWLVSYDPATFSEVHLDVRPPRWRMLCWDQLFGEYCLCPDATVSGE